MRFLISIPFVLMVCTVFAEQPESPFPPPNAEEAARLDKLLKAWETQSQATKTFACDFQCWHYDRLAAPAGIHSVKESGRIAYASPDKGLYRVDEQIFNRGMKQGKPLFAPRLGYQRVHWILNGSRIVNVDQANKKITIDESGSVENAVRVAKPFLPLVFQIDAKEIRKKYWIREIKPPKEGMYLLEAWPKNDIEKHRYQLLQIALDERTLQPEALIMYAPHFDAKTAPSWLHYEFKDVERNTAAQELPQFDRNFTVVRNPSWHVTRHTFPGK